MKRNMAMTLRSLVLAVAAFSAASAQDPAFNVALHPPLKLESLKGLAKDKGGREAVLQLVCGGDTAIEITKGSKDALVALGFTPEEAHQILIASYRTQLMRGNVENLSAHSGLEPQVLKDGGLTEKEGPKFLNGMRREYGFGFSPKGNLELGSQIVGQAFDGMNPALSAVWARGSAAVCAEKGSPLTFQGQPVSEILKKCGFPGVLSGEKKGGLGGFISSTLNVKNHFISCLNAYPQVFLDPNNQNTAIWFRSRRSLEGYTIVVYPMDVRPDGVPDVPAYSFYVSRRGDSPTRTAAKSDVKVPATVVVTPTPMWNGGWYGITADFGRFKEGLYMAALVPTNELLKPLVGVVFQVGGNVPPGGQVPRMNW